jgi:hypothetical protein
MANQCSCPEPPGGYASCSDEQLAICRIVHGRIKAECIDLPASASEIKQLPTAALLNWALTAITLEHRGEYQLVTDEDYQTLKIWSHAARERVETTDVNGDSVSFRLPAVFVDALGLEATQS